MTPRWLFALVIPVVAATVFWEALPAGYRESESSDYESFYRPVTEQVLAGNGIVLANGAPALRTPPGFPMMLAVALRLGNALRVPEPTVLNSLTLVCVAISSLFMWLISRDLWCGWLGLLPSAAWSTYPLALWLTKQPNSEIPFTLFLFAATYALWKLVRAERPLVHLAAAIGVLIAMGMLIRPIALLLPLVVALIVWFLGTAWRRRGRALAAAVVIVTSAGVVTPWVIHASNAAGRFVLLSTADVPTLRDGLTFGVNTDKAYRTGIFVPNAIRVVMNDILAQYDDLTSFGAIARAGTRELREHPVGTIGLVGMKLSRAWYGTDSQRLDTYVLAIQVVYLAVLGWGTLLACRLGGDPRRLAVICVGIVTYFWLMSAIALPIVRYMVPAIGLTFLLLPAIVLHFDQRHT